MVTHSKHLPAEERRAATVEAVVELAAKQNPSEITTTAIAKHMGVTQGALFKHFPTKDAILEAVMEWVAKRLLTRLDKAAETAATPLGKIEAMFMAQVGFVVEHPGVPRMLFGELQRAQLTAPKLMAQSLLRNYHERLSRLIEAGKTSGEIRLDLDTEAAATLLIGMLQGLVMQSLLAGDVTQVRSQAPRVFAIYLSGIGSSK
ncbi:TetR/AcrR family transcriptional regulator [Halothiobacillus sp.]|jgi:AcrR family transcriptional regulator|uniref:TetR/AcrR family transcriptional regulator n=1 Tax=Halothiobacillus sp. TaxID=1891311 RepID=UPI0026251324|nr:TetR/AcrR family transcriptional regulator [Halothiobacillus sp.]MDD4966934.1 TetR/AcrR family transcriptional regulator [Halothiobacillus sp.]